MTGLLPRILATVLLLVSLAMIVPLAMAVSAMFRGQDAQIPALLIPLIFLATGAILTWLLAKKTLAVHLFLMAFALWVVAAGYYFVTLTA